MGAITPIVDLTLYDVPADVSGSMTVNGPSVPVTIAVRGQNGLFTFSGTAGQQVTVHVTGNTICVPQFVIGGSTYYGVAVTLSGNGVYRSVLGCQETQFDLPAQVLPVTGQYSVAVDPQNWATGSLNLSVTSP
ncbi:MAG: hypothetical protein HYS04_10290 [Acidobacteria bacterium]|nr:hypothetical protein [Acidobacteriota bacterium]